MDCEKYVPGWKAEKCCSNCHTRVGAGIKLHLLTGAGEPGLIIMLCCAAASELIITQSANVLPIVETR